MNQFTTFHLPEPVLRALAELRFSTPTPIQVQAIPPGLSRRDLVGIAQTGTGKTAAFCIPILVRLMRLPEATALVLAPTRELALQIDEFWHQLSRYAPNARGVTLIGGMAMQPQVRALRQKARMIIATPGRLVDHLRSGTISLARTEILVLDEADRMLDMGFAPQLQQIMRYVPKARQTMMFSATWDDRVHRLASHLLKDPVQVKVSTGQTAAPKIEQAVIETTVQGKNATLVRALKARPGSTLIFARTKSRTDRLARFLHGEHVSVGRIHGGRSQAQRTQALHGFKTGKITVLVATDIAARGIDVVGVAHVINYDLPRDPEDYIHRIGRTGRAGASGHATSLVTPEDRGDWQKIRRLFGQAPGARPTPSHPQSHPRDGNRPQSGRSTHSSPHRPVRPRA